MNQFLQILFAWGPFLSIVGALLMGVVLSFAAALVWPRYVMAVFLAIFILSPNEGGWAMEDTTSAFNVYAKGQRAFVFPALVIYLWGLWLSVQLRFAYSGERGLSSPMKWWFVALAGLMLAHALFAPAFDQNVFLALSQGGFLNVVNMGAAFSLMLQLFVTSRDVGTLERWFLILFGGRMVWGLVRFAALGGDPMNVYENVQELEVRVTFFDINDNLLACTALALSAWRLIQTRGTRWSVWNWLQAVVVVLAVFTILLSFRRTAWFGLVLALAIMVTSPHWPRRLVTVGIAGAAILPAIFLLGLKRFSESAQTGGGLLSKLFPDVLKGGSVSVETGRLSELTAMVRSVDDNWLWGLGAWGEFAGRFYPDIAFHRGYYGYVHSGFGHMYLKAGAVGVVLFSGLFAVYVAYVARHRSRIDARNRAIFECSLAALAFSVPNLVGGTPITELRTMVLLGVLMSLPFIAVGLQSREKVAS